MIKLIGIAIIVLGFLFRLESFSIIIFSGLVTLWVSGEGFVESFSSLGQIFLDNRVVSVFILSLPLISILERFGLKEKSTMIVKSMKNITISKILTAYMFLRQASLLIGLRLVGHVQFIRPIIYPMVDAAVPNKNPKMTNHLKADTSAVDNFANFYSQNLFIAAPGILLILKTMESFGYQLTNLELLLYAIPMSLISMVVISANNYRLGKKYETASEKISQKS